MNEDIQRTVASVVTSQETPKTIAQIVSDDESKIGNSSEKMKTIRLTGRFRGQDTFLFIL